MLSISPRRFMNARLALTALLGTTLTLTTGCLESMEHITLQPDGSGTVTLTVNVDNAKAQQLKEMMEAFKSMQGQGGMGGGMGGMGGAMPDMDGINSLMSDLHPSSIIAKVKGKKGLKVIEHSSKTDKEKGKTHHRVVIGFDKLQSFYGAGIVENIKMALKKNEDGSYTLTRSVAMPGMNEEQLATKEGKEMLEAGKGITGFAGDALKGFQLSFAFEAPGKISKTNGTRAESGNGAGWAIDLKSMFEPANWKQEATFSGTGLKLEPFTLTAEQIKKAADEARKAAKAAADEAAKAAKKATEEAAKATDEAKKASDEAAKAAEDAKKAAKEAEEAAKKLKDALAPGK